jgi:hypothetical protein
MPIRKIAILLWLVLAHHGALACKLQIHVPPQGPKGRVFALNLGLSHGFFDALKHIPNGWIITIDNDPSWNTSLHGHAIVGTAFLDRSELSGIVSVTPEPGLSCRDMIKNGNLIAAVTLYLNDKMRDYRVTGSDLELTQ